jgi:hypothetical protein
LKILHENLESLNNDPENENKQENTAFDMDLERIIKKNNALAVLYLAFTGRELQIHDTQDVTLEIDLNLEGDRIFLQKLSGIKLPEIFYLKVINFYE